MGPDPVVELVPCVGAVVVHRGRLLVVRRGHEPGRGLWSVPGGRVEAGESLAAACAREVREETGIDVVAGAVVGRLERAAPSGATYVIDDLACTLPDSDVPAPEPVAGDDADDARWVTRAELEALPRTPQLLELLDAWEALSALH
jgi:ADP-ribose pyrophosphatase YjhB (NUDIX family)